MFRRIAAMLTSLSKFALMKKSLALTHLIAIVNGTLEHLYISVYYRIMSPHGIDAAGADRAYYGREENSACTVSTPIVPARAAVARSTNSAVFRSSVSGSLTCNNFRLYNV